MADHSALIEWLERQGARHRPNADKFAEAAAALRDLTEWRDISTAPKDGTVVLTYGSLHNDHAPYGIGETPTVKISQFSSRTGGWVCDSWGSHEPVWWLPLPSAPNQAKEAGE